MREMQIRTKIPSYFLAEPIYESDHEKQRVVRLASRIPQRGTEGTEGS